MKTPLKEPETETDEPDMDTKVNIKVTNFGASHGATALKAQYIYYDSKLLVRHFSVLVNLIPLWLVWTEIE